MSAILLVAGSDHAGLELKNHLLAWLHARGFEVEDVGTYGPSSCDYPDYAGRVSQAVGSGRARFGLLVCGTGQGMAMAANKWPGVRAAVVGDTFSARASREHNDANVLCLGARVIGPGLAEDILSLWLATEFAGGRHAGRIAKMMASGQP